LKKYGTSLTSQTIVTIQLLQIKPLLSSQSDWSKRLPPTLALLCVTHAVSDSQWTVCARCP